MNPTDYVKQAIYHWPTLYENRTDVMSSALVVNGSGNGWGEDGELVSGTDHAAHERDDPHHTDPAKFVAAKLSKELGAYLSDKINVRYEYDEEEYDIVGWRFEELPEPRYDRALNYLRADGLNTIDRLRERAAEECAKTKYLRDNLDEVAQLWVPMRECYPMYEYDWGTSNLLSFPDNITPEWMAEVERMAWAVLRCPWSVYHPERPSALALRNKFGDYGPMTPEERLARYNMIRSVMDEPLITLAEVEQEQRKYAAQREIEIRADAHSVRRNRHIAHKTLLKLDRIKRERGMIPTIRLTAAR